MSWYNELHDGMIPETQEDEMKALSRSWDRGGHEGDSGIQIHSCCPQYPWVHVYIENHKKKTCTHYWLHPNGSRTTKRTSILHSDADKRVQVFRIMYAVSEKDVISRQKAVPDLEADADQIFANSTIPKEPDCSPRRYKFGDRLPNGATVVDHKGNVVLAYRSREVQEWVTWIIDGDGNTFWGSYFSDLTKAALDFHQRCLSEICRESIYTPHPLLAERE